MASYTSPSFRPDLTRRLQLMLSEAARAGVAQLRENLSGRDRTGTHWPGNPYPSSSPEEFPTEQTTALVNDSDYEPTTDPLVWRVGFFGPNAQKYEDLEFLPPELGGRQPLARTIEDPETHARMLQAMQAEARSAR